MKLSTPKYLTTYVRPICLKASEALGTKQAKFKHKKYTSCPLKRSVEISSQDELIFSAHPEVEGGNILKQLF